MRLGHNKFPLKSGFYDIYSPTGFELKIIIIHVRSIWQEESCFSSKCSRKEIDFARKSSRVWNNVCCNNRLTQSYNITKRLFSIHSYYISLWLFCIRFQSVNRCAHTHGRRRSLRNRQQAIWVSVSSDRQHVSTQDAPSTAKPAHHVRAMRRLFGGRNNDYWMPAFV